MRSWAERFEHVFAQHLRIALTGPSGTGKTTLAAMVHDRPVIHADDYKGLGWSESSEATADRVNRTEGPLLVEGAAVPRALRKGMSVDAVIYLISPKRLQTKGQQRQGKGVDTVFIEWRHDNPHVPVYYED